MFFLTVAWDDEIEQEQEETETSDEMRGEEEKSHQKKVSGWFLAEHLEQFVQIKQELPVLF